MNKTVSCCCWKASLLRAMAASATRATTIVAWTPPQLPYHRHFTRILSEPCSSSPSSSSSSSSRGYHYVSSSNNRRPRSSVIVNSSASFVADPSFFRKSSKTASPSADEKLVKLRQLFEEKGIDAYIIPSEDPHQSEYSADCFMRRAYISGFTGSAGTAVVTKEMAALWTDGRYFLQAENQLGVDWQLMRAGTPGVPSYGEWLRDQLKPGSKVGIDPFLFSSEAAMELERCLNEKDHELVLVQNSNLVDDIWGDIRPSLPSSPLRVHDINFAGIDVATKINNLRKDLSLAGTTAIIITMLDEVAWLFNLRGNDVPHNPVAYAYAIVEPEVATLFIDPSKISDEVSLHLENANVSVKPYSEVLSYLERLASCGCKLWLDPSRVSVAIANTFNAACASYYEKCNGKNESAKEDECNGPVAVERSSPIALAKAKKNYAELKAMRQAHLRDAAALTEFWAWLENTIVNEKNVVTEVEVADELLKFRARQSGFLDTSFDTISGSGPNGAIIHYRPEAESCRTVDDKHVFLLDSGAQYIDGTTDVTRTVHFGTPTSHQKECYTRVLKGHIAIDKAVFPEGTPGFVLDVMARSSLWKIGLDYRHGTGHGVGAALNVHEGPQSISSRFGNMTGLEAGMIVSNEPGYYEDRSFGIRIENLLVVREVDTPFRFGGITYLGFEKLTYVPIQMKLIDASLLCPEEIEWLNNYHQEVWEKVSPLVKGDALAWLKENTKPFHA